MTDPTAEADQKQKQEEQGQTVVPQKETASETEVERNDREKEELRRMLSADSDEDKDKDNSDTNSNSGSDDDSDDSDDDSDSDADVNLIFPEDDKSVTPKKPTIHPKGPSPYLSKLSAPVAALGIDVANGYLPGYLPPTSGVTFNHLFFFDQMVSRLEGVSQEADRMEEKPWNKPGADIRDFFNYGFNEKTWEAYLKKQKALRSMDFSTPSVSTANANLTKALSIPTSSSGNSDGINLTYSQAPSSFNNKGGGDKKKGADGKPLYMMETPPMTLTYGPGATGQRPYYEQGLLPHMPLPYHMGNPLMPTPSFQTLPAGTLPLKSDKRDSERSERSNDRDRNERSGSERDRSGSERERSGSDRKDRDRSGSERSERSDRRSTGDRDRNERSGGDREKSDRHRDKDHDRDRGRDRDRESGRSSGSGDKRDRSSGSSSGSKRSNREFTLDSEPDKKRKRDP